MKYLQPYLNLYASLRSIAENENSEKEIQKQKLLIFSLSEKKPIMLFFTGSDWCGWCMRLKKEVFNFPEFETWTKENVVLVELDFPRRKAIDPKILNQNRELARIFGVSGYPTVWFVNPQKLDSNKLNFIKLGKLGYLAGGTNKWISAAEIFFN
jgi:protein disulfide-isomerase